MDQLGVSPDAIPDVYTFSTNLEISPLEQLNHIELIKAQRSDSALGVVLKQLEDGKSISELNTQEWKIMILQRESAKVHLKKRLLFCIVQWNGKEVCQLILPAEYRPMVLKAMHDDIGHFGTERTIELIKDWFYWPRMAFDITQYIKNCGRCVAHKTVSQRSAPLQQITSTGPLDLVCIWYVY